MAEGAAAKVGRDGHSIGVQELVHPVQSGICRIPVDRRDVRVFEALNEIVDGGGRHGGRLTN